MQSLLAASSPNPEMSPAPGTQSQTSPSPKPLQAPASPSPFVPCPGKGQDSCIYTPCPKGQCLPLGFYMACDRHTTDLDSAHGPVRVGARSGTAPQPLDAPLTRRTGSDRRLQTLLGVLITSLSARTLFLWLPMLSRPRRACLGSQASERPELGPASAGHWPRREGQALVGKPLTMPLVHGGPLPLPARTWGHQDSGPFGANGGSKCDQERGVLTEHRWLCAASRSFTDQRQPKPSLLPCTGGDYPSTRALHLLLGAGQAGGAVPIPSTTPPLALSHP